MITLNGKRFSPITNSDGGRVKSDAVFVFEHESEAFRATYSGSGFSDGHLIGRMTSDMSATLIYHSRAEDGSLEAGEADATFEENKDGKLSISMNWRWLNGSRQPGTSYYEELT